MLYHRNGRISNLSIKISGLTPSQTQQLLGFLKENLHSPADLINLNHPDKRQFCIGCNEYPPFTIGSLSAKKHPNGYPIVIHQSLFIIQLQFSASCHFPKLIADLAMSEHVSQIVNLVLGILYMPIRCTVCFFTLLIFLTNASQVNQLSIKT